MHVYVYTCVHTQCIWGRTCVYLVYVYWGVLVYVSTYIRPHIAYTGDVYSWVLILYMLCM
jgi:hypothetical protein